MGYFVYIIYSDKLDQYYTGQTDNVAKRLLRHNSGHGKHTRKGMPWRLVWQISFESRSDAVKLERKIKKRGAKRYLEDVSSIE